MATLKSKKLQEALKKAKNVGRAEEPVTVDNCALVLQSLSPTQYEAIVSETKDLENIEYFQAYQVGHVCRSIVEIEGVDLREVEFIEAEVPSGSYVINALVSKGKAAEARETLAKMGITLTVVPPDPAEGERTVLMERHEWVRQQVVTWSREAIATTYRKIADVVAEGERRAREKVQFHLDDESAEDKYRRLLAEAKELEGSIPPDLTKKILEDSGYLQKSTPEELEAIAQRAREFAASQRQAVQEAEVEEVEEPEPAPVVRRAAPPPTPPVEDLPPPLQVQQDLQAELAERLKARVPMNRQPMQAPTPVGAEPQPRSQSFVPPQLQATRAAQIAALEGQLDPELAAIPPQAPPTQAEVAELSKPVPRIDGGGVKTILNQPPVAGINPRFRRPQ